MKAKLLPAIVFAIAIVAFGVSSSAQERPSRWAMIFACNQANTIIPELIELAPHAAPSGRLSRAIPTARIAWATDSSDSWLRVPSCTCSGTSWKCI